jgi:hypothetical protein
MLGNFTLVEFESQDTLWSYISDTSYGFDTHPAICFGFKITVNNRRDYELELFLNDLWPDYY